MIVISETWMNPDRETNFESHRYEINYINRKKWRRSGYECGETPTL